MRHAHTKTLHAYWDARRSGRSAPARADIAPNDVAGLLAHIFMLRRMDRDHHVFRIAGTGVCRLHNREFKDQNFLSLWSGQDRAHMTALLEGALAAPAPAFAVADALAIDGRSVEVEVSLFPLRGPEGVVDRCLGLYQPIGPDSLGGRPVIRHVVKELHPANLPEPTIRLFRTAAEAPASPAANDRAQSGAV
ncbi:PAS domain-containing protein [Marinicauda salina]|uniref:PAS domain-containing protein n=1 Tax=Marinicauda salina TaxID=2135793 RepID=A0A2U2BTX9_9PROT|nr:PAS domain-containing protein [Marinicauda salina]PWE17471.1 PAS domain-containing protein [Marinicauda salina]